ncbi:HAMP domain-containing sensor histidine kinase [Helicobacter sp. MIT 05-5294]|uniref:sensor histidine kinase n=1 Tax=Helicobacter sp. MIT 05-5294 TaxID=1548150 RepID=UPI000B019C05|nr:HAMP domain-containing sensor histidine kinase [Helicobacter sp. MIT 05-5294]
MKIFRIFGTTLEAKARVLVFNIASGLLSLAVVSYVYYFSLKYDYDVLFTEYSQSLISLEELHKCANNVQNILASQQREEEILKAQKIITTQWETYLNLQSNLLNESDFTHFLLKIYYLFGKEDLNLQEKSNFQTKQNNLNNAIHQYLILLQNAIDGIPNIEESLQQGANYLNQEISRMIDASLHFVEIKKVRNNTLHNVVHKVVLVMMCLIMLTTILLSFLILRNIKSLHAMSEKKVQEKTKELQNLNNSLQEKIKQEVLESRKKDQIMYQQARLASMGEMIGNIAHQWRQPLNALMLLIQTFKVKSQNGKLTQEFIDLQVNDGLKIAKAMSQTIEDFRNFFHSSSDKEIFNLRENIQDSISLVDAFLRQNEINIAVECPKDIELYGYKSAFSQVILNLIKNSEDILKERLIAPARIRIDVSIENHGLLQELSSKGCVKILFTDNGGGIKLEDIQKVFEPYFTTKHKSVGTGIGLYMSKQIIEKQMQGSIEVRNVRYNGESDLCDNVCQENKCPLECPIKDGTCGAQFIITIPLKSEE